MLRRSALLLAIVASALVFPGVASAGALTSRDSCWEQGHDAILNGTGFTPDLSVNFTGEKGSSSALPDGDGNFTDAGVGMPDSNSYIPKPITIVAHDQANPANDASINLQYVKFGSNLPVSGKPSKVVTWQFAGWPANATIYAHFRYAHNGPYKGVKDIRFGKVTGACALLSKKAKRIPGVKKPKRGSWMVQVDTHPKYSSNTGTFYWYKYFIVH